MTTLITAAKETTRNAKFLDFRETGPSPLCFAVDFAMAFGFPLRHTLPCTLRTIDILVDCTACSR